MAGLADIPFYGAYTQRTAQNQAEPMRHLEQAKGVIGLQQVLQAQAQDQHLRDALAASGGDVEKALQAAIAGGNLAGAAKLAPIVEARRKAKMGQPIGSGGLLNNDGTITPPAARPQTPTAPKLVVLQQHRERVTALPDDHPQKARLLKEVEDAIKKESTHQAPVNVYSGSLVPGVDAQGNSIFVQPSGRPDTPPRVVPGVFPPPSAQDRKAGLSDKEALNDMAEIERLGNELDTLVQNNQGVVRGVTGPQGVVGRAVDLVAGAAGGATPAIDFENKSQLFLSSVRKLVEKDTNLSNEERNRLLGAIGTGFWQTGSSSIRARNDVMNYVRSRRVSGLKGVQGTSQIESAVKAAGWVYEPNKYEYRIMSGQVQRKAK